MLLVKKGDYLSISIPFEDRARFKKVVLGAEWDAGSRSWVVPATIATFRNLRRYNPDAMDPLKMSPGVREWYNKLLPIATRLNCLQKGTGKEVEFPEEFKFAVPPFKHQKDAMAFCLNIPKAALWLDMGLGKTYTSINIARYRHMYNNVNRVLIVAPRSLLHQWQEELKKYVIEDNEIVILEGTPQKKNKCIAGLAGITKLLFVIVTYESLLGLKTKLLQEHMDMFILDEATKIKNPKAVRSQATVEMCKNIRYGVELTGLPYLNNPADLFSQFLALDYTVYGKSLWDFGSYFIDYAKMPFGRMMIGLKHVDELKRRAYFIAFSRRKEDCLDLPPKAYTERFLPMYDTQKVWYDKISKETMDIVSKDPEMKELGSLNNVLVQLEKLQQVTAGFVLTEDHDVIWFDSPKYAEACDIIKESSEQFIIWCRHVEAIKHMQLALDNRKIESVVFNRDTTLHTRIQEKKRFKEGKLRVLICQISSESKGLDLTSKTGSVNAIYLENSFSLDDRFQSESRQHRIGMKGIATYVDLILEDTIDEYVLTILKDKLKISEYIAKHGVSILLGKGGSIMTRRSRSKKKVPVPVEEPKYDLKGLEGFDE